MGTPGWVIGRATGCGGGRGPPAIGVGAGPAGRGIPAIGVGAGPAGRGMPAGPGMGWGTPAVGAGRGTPAGAKAPVAAGRGAADAMGWLGRGTEGWEVGGGAAATAGRFGIIG